MYRFETQVRVRYGETDRMGYLYYGNYAELYEVGRVETMRSLGLTYKEIEDQGVNMPVLELHCKYIRPAYYDELLTIKTTIPEAPETRITFNYEIINETGILINRGSTVLVFVSAEKNRPVKAPGWISEKLKGIFSS